MTLRAMQWTLFAVMAVTVPLPFVAVLAGGFLPLVVVAVILGFDSAIWLLGAVHVAFYGPLLFFASRFIARWLGDRPRPQQRLLFGGVVGSLLLMGLAPLYGASHGTISFRNVYQVYWQDLGLRYARQAPEDWMRGWSSPDAGRSLRVCTEVVPASVPSGPRSYTFRWLQESSGPNRLQDGIRWGIEPAAQERQGLDDAVRREFERSTPRTSGPVGGLARSLRSALGSMRKVEPWQYGEYSTGTATYHCVMAPYR
jgi:hypothetical protein